MVRLIKLAILSFIFIFLLLTLMSLFIPSHIRISKATNLAGDKTRVFALINDTSRWKEWHPWFQQSPGLINKIGIAWKAQSDSLSVVELSQPNKKTLLNSWQVHTYASSDSITLQWYMDFYPKWYPWEKFSSLFYEGTYGVVMEKGLSNIKSSFQ
ncbi:MAG: hypothetical protein JWP88_512 [Flaviaesturariibacter sp.]|nr:hypothetical protein [Flaviaesturariibacter sp.]